MADGEELVIRPYSAIAIGDLVELWRYRELLWMLAKRDITVRYKQAAFGVAWAVLQPLIQMLVFTVLFSRFSGARGGGGVPYPLFCYAGLTVWLLFSTGLAHAAESLVTNSNLVTKVYFPRALMPTATVLAALVDFAVAFALLLVMLPLFHQGLHASALLALPITGLGALAALALGLWLAALNVQFRDVRYVLPFFIQTLIFVTPVFYPATMLPEKLRPLLALNPMSGVVEGFRAAMFGTAMPWRHLGLAAGQSFLLAVLGFMYFRRMEQTFADRI